MEPGRKLPSKSRIDKAGRSLAKPSSELTEEDLELEDVFDSFREAHLQPLSQLTGICQDAVGHAGCQYYIAQRLKRRPQIVRKLNRLSVRLTQLQDIGGLRIIVDSNELVDTVNAAVEHEVNKRTGFKIVRSTDYRPLGRDDSGYRALHKIVETDNLKIEIQIRTRAQHYWAESIERTSVFYGRRLKEGEGSAVVLAYFKMLSAALANLERGGKNSSEEMAILKRMRASSEDIIRRDGHSHLLDSRVDEDVIRTLIQKERSNPSTLNNWILVFNWKTGNFVTWDIVSRNPQEAVAAYSRYETEFPETDDYEVVLIGSSDVSTVQKTHSHYFGISNPISILEDLGQSIVNIGDNVLVDLGAKQILSCLMKRRVWGIKDGIQIPTLKNHFCKDVSSFDESLSLLIEKGLVVDKGGSGVTLNLARKADIEQFS